MTAGAGSMHALELKGRMMLVSVLRLHTADGGILEAVLSERMAEAPDLMRDMPVVVDLAAIATLPIADLLVVLEQIRRQGFKLIGLQQSGAVPEGLAVASGLPLLVLGGRAAPEPPVRNRPAEPRPEAPQQAAAPAVHTPTRVVTQHVRSGQQIYARGGDLIITGAVSAGAEILADGHIHIYGTLRGRALAGVRGLASASIFCRRLDAELVSIAGHYRIAEDILDSERGENRLVTLSGETIDIAEI
ncbi:septum site-determining protein MinC [Thioalkalivibrio nitratireducens]|nr:septum site-determining protein MinC [Thioalkalivibrio nitratireducens]